MIKSFDRFVDLFNQLHYWSGDGIKEIHVINSIKDNLFQSGAAYKTKTAEKFIDAVLNLKQTFHNAENELISRTAKKPDPIEHKEQLNLPIAPKLYGSSLPKQFYP